MMLRRNLLVSLAIILPLMGACSQEKSPSSTETPSQSSEIVMGLIPAESNEEMAQRFEPMQKYLEEELGRPVKVFQATDYTGVIEAMKRDRVDFAWFGPLSYVLAEQEADAEAFAVGVRRSTGSSAYRSIFLVPNDSPIQSIEDLKGKSVAFVDPASTSGALVPTYLTKKATGQMPQAFFGDLTYAGSHDASHLAVKNKTVDAGASNDITYNKMLEKGLISKENVTILSKSDPIPGSPVTYREDLDAQTKAKLQTAFVNAHQEIDVSGYGNLLRYEKTSSQDYQVVKDMVNELGLSREQMLD